MANRALCERHQRQRSTLPVIVRAQQDENVFQCHHDDQRPQDKGQNAEYGLQTDDPPRPAGRDHGFAERVKRTSADIAIDDADAADQEGLEAGGGMGAAMAICRPRFRGGNYDIAAHESGGLKMLRCTITKRSRLWSRA